MQSHKGPRPVAIVDLELANGSFTPATHMGCRYVIVRLHNVPLGVFVTAENEPATKELEPIVDRLIGHLARDSAERPPACREERIAALLACEHPRRAMLAPTLTVAVCTRNRTEDLEACLDHFEGALSASVELLVVDNAPSSNSTERLVKERFPWARYVSEPAIGLNRARNKAIAESTSDIIAFTDDDVRVEPNWVATVQAHFARNPEVALMTGLVLPFEFETEAQWLFELYGGFGRGFERRWLRSTKRPDEGSGFQNGMTGALGTGANMAFRRSAFARVGPFDPALDAGTATQGAGDLEMFFRVLKSGGTVCYNPEAVVRHCHRRTQEDLRIQIESWGTGVSAYLTRCVAHFPEERLPITLLRAHRFMSWFVPRVVSMMIRHPQTFELFLRELRGSLAGPALYRAAHAEAVALGDAFPVPTPRTTPLQQRVEVQSNYTATQEIDLSEVRDPLAVLSGATHVRVGVRERGRFLGEVTTEVHDGFVGIDRLHDVISRALPVSLLGIDVGAARRESLLMLRRQLNSLRDGAP